MKPIDQYPDKPRCEMCGALKEDEDRHAECRELIRRLALLADVAPKILSTMIYHMDGRTERYIASKVGITHQSVHERIEKACQVF